MGEIGTNWNKAIPNQTVQNPTKIQGKKSSGYKKKLGGSKKSMSKTILLQNYLIKEKILHKNCTIISCIPLEGCWYICPRDSCPRRPLSKGPGVQGTVVRGDFGPRRLLSKEAFNSDKLAQIFFLLFLIEYLWRLLIFNE